MRLIRAVIACALAVCAGISIPAAADAAPPSVPTAPYDALTVQGAGDSWTHGASDSYSFDDSNAIFQTQLNDPGNLSFFAQSNQNPSDIWQGTITAPSGLALAPGTYTTTYVNSTVQFGFDLRGLGVACTTQESGRIAIGQLGTDPSTGALTFFALDYSFSCGGGPALSGSVRWHSNANYIASVVSPSKIDGGTLDLGTSGSTQTITVTGTGVKPSTFGQVSVGGDDPSAFRLISDGCSGNALAYGVSCSIEVVPEPLAAGTWQARLLIPETNSGITRSLPLSVTGQIAANGTYYPLNPTRVLDTRSGLGAPAGALGAGGAIHLQVTGAGGVPATGVSAVVLNVTVTSPTAASFLTVWPTGTARPTTSNIDFPVGWTGANSTTVGLGTGGRVDIYDGSGTVQVIADVVGFYAADDSVLASRGLGGNLQPAQPTRVLDTRDPGEGGAVAGKSWITVPVTFNAGINPHVRALVVNVTVVGPKNSGFLTAWNGVGDPPLASTLNFTAGKTVPNMAIVPVAPCAVKPTCAGMLSMGIYNGSSGVTDILVDVLGFYDDGNLPDGLRYHPTNPTRIVDTRVGLGAPKALGSNSTTTITTPSALLDNESQALALNVTAVAPTADTYLTLWPAGVPGVVRPNASNLNPAKGSTVSNAATLRIGDGHGFNVYNLTGTTNLLIDVQGIFDWYPYPSGDPAQAGAAGRAATSPAPEVSARAPQRQHA